MFYVLQSNYEVAVRYLKITEESIDEVSGWQCGGGAIVATFYRIR